jgi:hypothetical protein
MCMKVLSGKSLAQVDPDQDEDEANAEELAEMDSFLIGACEDVVSALASALGGDFAKPFGQFLPLINQYYVSERDIWHSGDLLIVFRVPNELLPIDRVLSAVLARLSLA